MDSFLVHLAKLSGGVLTRDRRVKREARSKAYHLGHVLGRFRDGIARCKTCDLVVEVKDGEANGPAIRERCTQQLLEFDHEDQVGGTAQGEKRGPSSARPASHILCDT